MRAFSCMCRWSHVKKFKALKMSHLRNLKHANCETEHRRNRRRKKSKIFNMSPTNFGFFKKPAIDGGEIFSLSDDPIWALFCDDLSCHYQLAHVYRIIPMKSERHVEIIWQHCRCRLSNNFSTLCLLHELLLFVDPFVRVCSFTIHAYLCSRISS